MPGDSAQPHWTFERVSGVVGVAAAVLILVSAALGGGTPNEPTSTDQELLDFYDDSGNQFRLYVSAFVGLVAGLLFLWFLVGLHNRLQRVDKTGAPSFVFAVGIVFVTFALVGGAIGAAVPASLAYDDSIELTDVDTLRVVLILGNHWLPGAAASVARS